MAVSSPSSGFGCANAPVAPGQGIGSTCALARAGRRQYAGIGQGISLAVVAPAEAVQARHQVLGQVRVGRHFRAGAGDRNAARARVRTVRCFLDLLFASTYRCGPRHSPGCRARRRRAILPAPRCGLAEFVDRAGSSSMIRRIMPPPAGCCPHRAGSAGAGRRGGSALWSGDLRRSASGRASSQSRSFSKGLTEGTPPGWRVLGHHGVVAQDQGDVRVVRRSGRPPPNSRGACPRRPWRADR